MQSYGIPVVVGINQFVHDTQEEIDALQEACQQMGVECVLASVWENGPDGGIALAEAVVKACDQETQFSPLYVADETTIKEKISRVVKTIYGGSDVQYSKKAETQIKQFNRNGWEHLPVCMAKTQYSLSDDPSKLARPEGFTITIREFVPKIGAGFLVALTGDILTMPGLPKQPAALNMDVLEDGTVTGLF